MALWQVSEAKNRFSELLDEVQSQGPQVITRHGTERAVVLSMEAFRALTVHKPSLKQLLLGGPKLKGFAVKRSHEIPRRVDLRDLEL